MAKRKIMDDAVENYVPVITETPRRKTRKAISIDMAVPESTLGGEGAQEKHIPKLTMLTDTVDIRYGMLLHFFPKGGDMKLPTGTYETGYYVAANKHITKIHFPNTMELIGHGSFFHCEDLKSLLLSDNITMISALAFAECKNLCEVVFNSGLKEIGRKAFMGCKSLSAITIPKSVGYIGPEAFKDCVNLTYVKMPQKTQLSPTAFENCHIDLKFEYY